MADGQPGAQPVAALLADAAAQAFLTDAGWHSAVATPLAGDASSRRFLRLRRDDGSRAILMLTSPGPDNNAERFVTVARLLRRRGCGAPTVLAAAALAGFVLVEDLGDDLFARVIDADPSLETDLYAAAVDLLIALHRQPAPPVLTAMTPAHMAAMTAPAADWYVGRGHPRTDLRFALSEAFLALLRELDAALAPVLVHRDFHAENLVWRPELVGHGRVGLLDFQDACAGPAGYDLVSLLRDARRDLAPGLADAMEARFAAGTGLAAATLRQRCAVLGAQRNLRILGVFVRLARLHGKPRYLTLLPRVWDHLQADLAHPALAGLAGLVADCLPAPDATHLAALAP